MFRAPVLLWTLLVGFPVAASASVSVVLVDGTEFAAGSVERRGDVYFLELADGRTVTLPLGLVRGMRFTGDGPASGAKERRESPRIEIVLRNGATLSGVSLERRDDLYLLELDSGETVSLPVDLIREVRFHDVERPPDDATKPRPAGPPSGSAPAREPSVRHLSPPPSRQLAVFGEDPWTYPPVRTWTPKSSLGYHTDVTEFNPVKWFRAPTDPVWTPTSAYDTSNPLPDFNTVHWYRPAYNPVWHPSDGWGRATQSSSP